MPSKPLRRWWPEDGQVVFAEPVLTVRPAQREDHALAQRAHIDIDRIGDEERPFVELEHDRRVRRGILVEIFATESGPREHLSAAGDRCPLGCVGEAVVARRPRRPAELAAVRTLLEPQLLLL